MISILNRYVSPKALLVMTLEGILIFLSLWWTVRLRFWGDAVPAELHAGPFGFTGQALILVFVFQICFYYSDLYGLGAVQRGRALLIRLTHFLGAAGLMLGQLYLLRPPLEIDGNTILLTLVLAAGSVVLARLVIDKAWKTAPMQRVLIVGTGPLAVSLAEELLRRTDLNTRLAGFVDKPAEVERPRNLLGQGFLWSVDELESVALQHRISRIIVALEDRRGVLSTRDLMKLKMRGVRIEDAHSAMAALTGRVWLSTVQPSWFVFSNGFRQSRLTLLTKRIFDLFFASVGLVLSAPLMALVAIGVRLDSPGPILYRQVRVGLRGKCFELLKFRSMREDAEDGDGAQWAQENDPRVTRLGKYLRKYRLDELPQFINVIRGEMSFAGPRPERPYFVEILRAQIPYYDERHSVRPGITGWAQVEYGYGASVEDAYRKLEYDLFYLKNMSILFDCAIVFQTIRIVLLGRAR
jgi:sugar transferase (PEP-CTERM system associated)